MEYEGLPLSWEAHYGAALSSLAAHVGLRVDPEWEKHGMQVLRGYNTRLNPRFQEVSFAQIASELLHGLPERARELDTARAFFSPFRQRLRCLPDAERALVRLRAEGAIIGVFTDVPYGMPTELVNEDIVLAQLHTGIDVLVTSADVGYRKPDARTLKAVMCRCGVAASQTCYVGNEWKDVQAALAAQCEAILLDRAGVAPEWGQHRRIRSLIDV